MKTVIHKSKHSSKLTYHSTKVGSSRYLKVLYDGEILFSLTKKPVELMKAMLHVEAFIEPLLPAIDEVSLGFVSPEDSPVFKQISKLDSELTQFYKK